MTDRAPSASSDTCAASRAGLSFHCYRCRQEVTPRGECGCKDGICLVHGDCREVLPMLWGVDLILTDPDYGTGGWRRTRSGQKRNPAAQLIREEWDKGAYDWLGLLPDIPVMTFCPAASALRCLAAAEATGRPKHRCLYMQKRDPKPILGGRVSWSMEPIWVLSADGFQLKGGTDVIQVSTPRLGRDREATGHPYQKPLSVMRWALAKTTASFIVDPFVGSGTTLRAAKDLGRKAIGIEIDSEWCRIAAERLKQGVLFT